MLASFFPQVFNLLRKVIHEDFMSVRHTEDKCSLGVKCSVAAHSGIQCRNYFESLGKLKLQITKVS